MVPSNRVEFAAKVRRLIAARAGYLCSKPDCRRPTLGPGPGPQHTACIGVAAHIYSAAPGGPRGTGGWLPDRRAAVANRIWLCQHHAWLIDTNNGDAFPAKLLLQWRSLHQAFLQLEMREINPAPIGLVTEIAVSGGPGDLASRTLSLSMLNLVQGANDTGKSMLLDLLASPDAPHYLSDRRWMNGLSADIRWFDPNPRTLRLEAPAGQMRFVSEDRSTPVVSAPYRAVVVRGG